MDYPESDGKPIAETPLHMRVHVGIDPNPQFLVRCRSERLRLGKHVSLLPPRRPERRRLARCDGVFGVDKAKERRVFKTWEEKRKPSGIIEITSLKTKREDQKDKFIIYRDILKVKEYFLFDPLAEYLKHALIGYRLRAGEYLRIEEIDGRLPSKVSISICSATARAAFLESREAILAADDGGTTVAGRITIRKRKGNGVRAIQTRDSRKKALKLLTHVNLPNGSRNESDPAGKRSPETAEPIMTPLKPCTRTIP